MTAKQLIALCAQFDIIYIKDVIQYGGGCHFCQMRLAVWIHVMALPFM